MTEYNRHLEEYANYWQADFSKLVPSEQWGNKKTAEEYMQKYWLPEEEYVRVWRPIQNDIFVQGKRLPNLIYNSQFEMIVLKGGCLFVQEDFIQLQKAMQKVGEQYFVVVQHSQEFTEDEPMFRMKFPVNITWEELISGNYISAVLLEMSYNNYYVFGQNGKWGKYAATDNKFPLNFIGFRSELNHLFNDCIKQSEKEQEEIRGWLPLEYRALIS